MQTDQLSAVFGALADPTRRAILASLAGGERTVAEVGAPFAISQPAVSKHLRVLEQAGLITRRRRATARLSRLRAEPLRDATSWLLGYRAYWEESFERLDELLAALNAEEPGETPTAATPGETPTAATRGETPTAATPGETPPARSQEGRVP